MLSSDRRTADWSGALLAVGPPTGLVDECWVELDHPPSSADDPIFVLVDGPRPLVVGPFDQATLRPTPAETTAATLSPARIGLAGAVVLIVLTGGFWWAQREDRALYAVLGFRPAHLSVIAATDWLLTCACPALVGATWGTLLALAPDQGAVGIGPAASATAVLLLGSSLALVWQRASAQRIRARQVLAGI